MDALLEITFARHWGWAATPLVGLSPTRCHSATCQIQSLQRFIIPNKILSIQYHACVFHNNTDARGTPAWPRMGPVFTRKSKSTSSFHELFARSAQGPRKQPGREDVYASGLVISDRSWPRPVWGNGGWDALGDIMSAIRIARARTIWQRAVLRGCLKTPASAAGCKTSS